MASQYQRAKRQAFWQTFVGGALTIVGMSLWFMASGTAGAIAP